MCGQIIHIINNLFEIYCVFKQISQYRFEPILIDGSSDWRWTEFPVIYQALEYIWNSSYKTERYIYCFKIVTGDKQSDRLLLTYHRFANIMNRTFQKDGNWLKENFCFMYSPNLTIPTSPKSPTSVESASQLSLLFPDPP